MTKSAAEQADSLRSQINQAIGRQDYISATHLEIRLEKLVNEESFRDEPRDTTELVIGTGNEVHLKVGKRYQTDGLRFIGWTERGKAPVPHLPGYNWADYFSDDGCYRGADKDGVEPVMEDDDADL